ncbi:glutamate receptor ionotropic, delta-1-like [Epargyreus clarus]|uniref:glutamate receptor ionotropic, delta-1-like n=1 Tax=Epargyreus clarus TaxID=520877 RepID=UPI003C2F6527
MCHLTTNHQPPVVYIHRPPMATAMAGLDLIFSAVCNSSFCESIYDNPVIDAQLTTTQNFIQTLTDSVNGKHLKIATYNNRPLSWIERDDNGTLVGRGVAFFIVSILQRKFNFTYEIILPARNYEIGGKRPEDSLIGLVNSSKVDLAAAFLPSLEIYKKMVTFSSELDEGVWMMMLKRPKESAAGSGLLAPFDTYVWYLILIAVLAYGPCITFLTRLRSKLVTDKEQFISITPSIWFVYGSFIKQGTTLAPEANTTRVLFATWWIFIILLSSFYTANLTAFLTLSKFTLDIETPEDLFKKNYRWVAAEGSAVQYIIRDPEDSLYYLSTMVSNGRAQFPNVQSNTDFLPLVKGGSVLVKEQISIDHIMYNDYLQKTKEGIAESDRCTYVVAPKAFMKQLRGFAYPNNSTLNVLFDKIIIRLNQAGIIKFLEHRDLPTTKICPLDLQSKDRQLRNSDLMMTYIIMAIGLATAIAVFIGEMFMKRSILRKINAEKKATKSKGTKEAKFNDYNDSHPPPYESLFGTNSRYKINEKSKKKIVNGREYWVVNTVSGDVRLIPVRSPSAFLYR